MAEAHDKTGHPVIAAAPLKCMGNIVFILGPCEALFPVLAAATVMGTGAVVSSALIFSGATIAACGIAILCGL